MIVKETPLRTSGDGVSVTQGEGGERLEFLDAARGIAAMAVVIQHSLEQTIPGLPLGSAHYGNAGAFGVVIFFLVSGFIIPVSLRGAPSVAGFWGNRFFRLYPMYWVSLILTLVLRAGVGIRLLPPLFATHPVAALLANATMLQMFMRVPDAMGVYWTLPLELTFYGLCTLLRAVGWLEHSLRSAWIATGLLGLAVSVAGLGLHRSLPAGRLGLLVCAFGGLAACDAWRGRVSRRALAGLVVAVLVTLVWGFWFRFAVYPAHDPAEGWSLRGVCVSWGVAFASFALLYRWRAWEYPRLLLWLGRISYSVYLLHGLVMWAVPASLGPVGYAVASVLLTVVISTLTYEWIERPVIAWHRARVRTAASVIIVQ